MAPDDDGWLNLLQDSGTTMNQLLHPELYCPACAHHLPAEQECWIVNGMEYCSEECARSAYRAKPGA